MTIAVLQLQQGSCYLQEINYVFKRNTFYLKEIHFTRKTINTQIYNKKYI